MALAVTLAVFALGGTALVAVLQGAALAPRWGTVVGIVIAAASWSWHRVAPVASTVLVVATVAGYVLSGQPYGPVMLIVVLACFGVARRRSARAAAMTCACAAIVLAAVLSTRLDAAHFGPTVTVLVAWPSVFVLVPGLAGALTRTKAEAAERSRAELIAHGAYEERLRVAREIHDIAGHGFAVVAMQAGVALTVFDEQPAQAKVSLEAIHTSSEHALRELHATLGILHQDPPTAEDVPALVERVRATGLAADLAVMGTPEDLDAELSTIVYRVVQESLTNVLRHAGQTAVAITLRYTPEEVSLRITDRGTGPGTRRARRTNGKNAGRGLAGLHERVENLGGRFSATGGSAGGFEVTATLPTRSESR